MSLSKRHKKHSYDLLKRGNCLNDCRFVHKLYYAFLLPFCLLTTAIPIEAQTPPLQDYAFIDVNVIPMDHERMLENQVVVVENGRISALGPLGSIEVPEGAVRIDGRGKYLIPGLIDMHVHLLADTRIDDKYLDHELAIMLANGVTTIRIPIGRPELLILREEIARGERLGPRLYVAGPQLMGFAFGGNRHLVRTPEEAAAAVRADKAAGYDFVKLTFGTPPPIYNAIATTANELGIPMIGHVDPQVGLTRALAAGQQIEHMDGYLEALVPESVGLAKELGPPWKVLPHIDESRIQTIAAASAEAGAWVTPTLAYYNALYGPDWTDDIIQQSPDHRFVSPEVRNDLMRWRVMMPNRAPLAQQNRYVEVRNKLTIGLYNAGVKLMAGSDAPELMMLYGFTLHRELESFGAAGLSSYAALETATRNPAEYLGDLESYGTIEVGKQANMVLLAANPLDDIASTKNNEGVMLNGYWLPKADLQQMLDTAEEVLSQAPLKTSFFSR